MSRIVVIGAGVGGLAVAARLAVKRHDVTVVERAQRAGGKLQRYTRDARDDEGYAFLLFRKSDDMLLGGVNLSNVTRGIRQSCSVGYWIGQRHARRGYMTDAVHTAVSFAFDQIRLHRVEAGCVPTNAASAGLLRKVGFQDEGFARKYLNINGRWHDHLLFALLASDPRV